MNLAISYAITTKNETFQLKELLNVLNKAKDSDDEIVLLDDFSDNKETQSIIKNENVYYKKFTGDYAEQKNYLNSLCKNEYIFQFDGDEFPLYNLVSGIKKIIKETEHRDLYYIPRANYLEGITKQQLKKWNWYSDNKQRINYPDYQGRLFKNKESLKWKRHLHEQIKGYENFCKVPLNQELDIIHKKHISTQIKSFERYSKNYTEDYYLKK
jgi:hypothetical protein